MNEDMKKKFTDALRQHVARFSNTPESNVSAAMMKVCAGLSMNAAFLAAHADVLTDRKEIVAVLTALAERLYRMEEAECKNTSTTSVPNVAPVSP